MTSTAKLALALAVILAVVYVGHGSHGEIVRGVARLVFARAFLVAVVMVGRILHGDSEFLSIF